MLAALKGKDMTDKELAEMLLDGRAKLLTHRDEDTHVEVQIIPPKTVGEEMAEIIRARGTTQN